MHSKPSYTWPLTILLSALLLSLLTGSVAVQSAQARPGSPSGRWDSLPVAAASSALDPWKIEIVELVSGFTQPLVVTHAGDGSGRLFVVERAGRIFVYKKGSLPPTPFLDIRSIVNSSSGERGLLALAFHPNYETNRRFFTVHTAQNGALVLSRFTASAANPNQALPGSRVDLLSIPHPTYSNHNGGTLAFGPDGYLYWSTGDGGGGGDPLNNAQNLNSLLGKVLRLDVTSAFPYAIPPDNPFYNNPSSSIRKEIWAYGLRNPWRISFDRQTGDLYIGDVGQSSREEINFQSAGSAGGENYGWRVMEGSLCYNPSSGCDQSGKVLPVAEYSHAVGCSVTGGFVYRGSDYPSLDGHYLYGDFCSGVLFDLYQDPPGSWVSTQLLDTPYTISTFGEDEDGRLYLANYSTGRIYQLRYLEDLPAAPDNDDLASAKTVSGVPFSDSLDTSGATRAGDDPSVGQCGLAPGLASVWYSYTPAKSGPVYFDTFGSSYDTYIAVWTGTRGNLSPVACNDDDPRDGTRSAAGFDAQAGITYHIEIAEWNGNQGAGAAASGKLTELEAQASRTLVLHATSFQDVPGTYENWQYIETLYANDLTAGCSLSPLKFCPDTVLDRAQSAVFVLRGNFGSGYEPPQPPWDLFADDWSPGLWAEKWAEGMYDRGLTAGCSLDPLRFCPWEQLPRSQVAVFGLKLMHGDIYEPPPASGTVFADVTDTGIWYAKWAEQAYADGLLPECGTDAGSGLPLFCPSDLVDRAWGAYVIVKAKGLPLP